MKIVNLRGNEVIAEKVRIADTFFSRLIGLLNRRSLEKGEALILTPSSSIHSFFMRFAIDVLFLDKNGRIIKILPSFKPFRLSRVYFNSRTVIELPENTLQLIHVQMGDIVKIIPG